ncbi:hypothetical protein BJV82DRAFT_709833 [Fennellomyces sp. T-0311]|nr:hypothetical protein BJV82DRAFT_709833 [Fennellomyces sp. T-0311]
MTVPHIKLIYFDVGPCGNGEAVNLLLKDAGLSYDYTLIPVDEKWPAMKDQLLKRGNHFGALPFVEMDGKQYSGTTPILRILAKRFGYNGANEDEEHFIDSASDFCINWKEDSVKAIFSPNDMNKRNHYIKEQSPDHYARFEHVYGLHDGPYLLGEKAREMPPWNITYPDFMAYRNIAGDGRNKKGLDQHPNLARFVQAFEARTNLKSYLASLPENPLLM